MLIAVHNHKGGVGKTTLVAHLAYQAELAGVKTLAATIDRQGDLLRWFTRGEGKLQLDTPVEYGNHVTGLYSPDKFPTRLAKNFELTLVDTSPQSDVTSGIVEPDLWIVPVDNRSAIENLATILPAMLKMAPAILVFWKADAGGLAALRVLQDAARLLDNIEIYEEVVPDCGPLARTQTRYRPVWEVPFGEGSEAHQIVVRFANHIFKRAGVATTRAPKGGRKKGGRR